MPSENGKQVLRARPKVYLADAAIAPSVLLRGKSLLEDPDALGRAVETAFFKHVYTRYYARSIGFSSTQDPRPVRVLLAGAFGARGRERGDCLSSGARAEQSSFLIKRVLRSTPKGMRRDGGEIGRVRRLVARTGIEPVFQP